MNYAAMTQDEVIHYAGLHAATELERALVRVVECFVSDERDAMDCWRADNESLEQSLKDARDEAALNAKERDKLQDILDNPDQLAARLAELLC